MELSDNVYLGEKKAQGMHDMFKDVKGYHTVDRRGSFHDSGLLIKYNLQGGNVCLIT